ncbi:MAG: hypothetical protein AB7H77_10090 [Bdellovibrionales bacterium]
MRKLLLIPAALAVFLAIDVLIASWLHPEARSPQEAVKIAGVDLVAKILAKTMKLRMKLPQPIDDITQLEDIAADRGTVIYTLSLKADRVQFDAIMREIMKNLRETVCAREDYRKMFAYGLSISLNFHSVDGVQAPPMIFTPQSCPRPAT